MSQFSLTKEVSVQKAEIVQAIKTNNTCGECGVEVGIANLQLDICHGKSNAEVCVGCIKKRHNITNEGFLRIGDEVEFYSQTTGIERVALKGIYNVGGCVLGNSVFSNTIQCDSKEYGVSCYGVTKEFAEYLISNVCKNKIDGEFYQYDEKEADRQREKYHLKKKVEELAHKKKLLDEEMKKAGVSYDTIQFVGQNNLC